MYAVSTTFLRGWCKTLPIAGNPIQLQKECTATAPAKCPVLKKMCVANQPKAVVYPNWKSTCSKQNTGQTVSESRRAA